MYAGLQPPVGGPSTQKEEEGEGGPISIKRINQSSDLIPPVLAKATGTVLDIGPGTGTQMPLLCSPEIKTIYGPEPCKGLHGDLTTKIHAYGLQEKYHILTSSVEASELVPALEKEGVIVNNSSNGLFDTIICVRVLCSVPNPEKTIAELYSLLKPGGRVLVTEHVVNPWRTAKGSVVARVMQRVYQALGWSLFLGDCRLDRDTERLLKGAAAEDGGWETVELDRWFGKTVLPYISGFLVKKG